jgi:hypothetical protein
MVEAESFFYSTGCNCHLFWIDSSLFCGEGKEVSEEIPGSSFSG